MGKTARVCGKIGCPEIVIGSNYCPTHEIKKWEGSTWVAPKGWKATRASILHRDKHTCQYCGQPANQVDHVLPVSQGGTHSRSNLVASCATCNNAKNQAQKNGLPYKAPNPQ